MGDDYCYYGRRGERLYEYSTAGPVASRGRPSRSSPRIGHASERRQSTREQERSSRGTGDERQSRSRSRSQSRTPSPALLSSHNNSASPTMSESGTDSGKGKSKSAFSPTSNGLLAASSTRTVLQSDHLSLPARGRQLDAPSRSPNGIPLQQDERRGRSATRTSSSSSSWDRERGSSGSLSSTSPMGSLSPDGIDGGRRTGPGVGSVLGTVLGGRRAQDRVIEAGQERAGRERTSSRVVSVATDQCIAMNASITSATSSSSSSNASTIMPKQAPLTNEKEDVRVAEETLSKKPTLTTANSSALTSWDAKPETSSLGSNRRAHITSSTNDGARTSDSISTSASSSTSTLSPMRSSSKFRPPLTLKPTSPSPARPSTSFAAVVSPTVTAGPPTMAPIGSVGGSESTIVGKAVDIVSSAGLYLGLWGRERPASAPSSPL